MPQKKASDQILGYLSQNNLAPNFDIDKALKKAPSDQVLGYIKDNNLAPDFNIDGALSHLSKGTSQQYPPLSEVPRTAGDEILTGALHGVGVALPETIGDALKYTGKPGDTIYDYGQSVVESAKKREQNDPERYQLRPKQHNSVVNALASGADMLPQSLAPAALVGTAIAAAPVEIPVGAAILTTGVLSAAPAGMAQGEQTYENIKKAGGTEEDATEAGRINALIEWGLEAGSSMFELNFLGKAFKAFGGSKVIGKTSEDILSKIANPKAMRDFIKGAVKTDIAEVSTETVQNTSEAYVENKYGGDAGSPIQQGLASIPAVIGMSTIMLPFGGLSHAINFRRNRAIVNALEDENAPKSHRVAASMWVADQIKRSDPVAAKQWSSAAAMAITKKEPITLGTPEFSPTDNTTNNTQQEKPVTPSEQAAAQTPTVKKADKIKLELDKFQSIISGEQHAAREAELMQQFGDNSVALQESENAKKRLYDFAKINDITPEEAKADLNNINNDNTISNIEAKRQEKSALEYNLKKDTTDKTKQEDHRYKLLMKIGDKRKLTKDQKAFIKSYDDKIKKAELDKKRQEEIDSLIAEQDVTLPEDLHHSYDYERHLDNAMESGNFYDSVSPDIAKQIKSEARDEVYNGNTEYDLIKELRQHPISLASIKADYNADTIRELRTKFKGIFTKNGRSGLDEMGGDKLIERLKALPAPTKEINRIAKQKIEQYHDAEAMMQEDLKREREKAGYVDDTTVNDNGELVNSDGEILFSKSPSATSKSDVTADSLAKAAVLDGEDALIPQLAKVFGVSEQDIKDIDLDEGDSVRGVKSKLIEEYLADLNYAALHNNKEDINSILEAIKNENVPNSTGRKTTRKNANKAGKGRVQNKKQKITSPKQKSTVLKIKQKVSKVVSKRGRKNLGIKVVQSVGGIQQKDDIKISSGDGNTQGYYNPKTNKITLVADNITPDEVPGLLLHEITHRTKNNKGWAGVFGNQADKIISHIKLSLKAGNDAWKKAETRAVDAKTDSENLLEETITYFLANKENAKLPIFKRIKKAISSFLFRVGIKTKVTDDIIHDLAKRSMLREAKAGVMGGVNEFAVDAGVKFSKAVKKITDNPNFRKWFGDSKVVDENGEPLVVYHGTNADFNVFSTGLLGKPTKSRSAKKGFFFSDNKQVAAGYGDLANSRKVQDLIDASTRAERNQQWDKANLLMSQAEKLEQDMNDEPIIMPTYLSLKNVVTLDAEGSTWIDMRDNVNVAIDQAKKDGMDGVIIKNFVDNADWGSGREATHYVVFNPTQIKSIYNEGTFDINNPNILKSKKPTTLFSKAPKKSVTDAFNESKNSVVESIKNIKSIKFTDNDKPDLSLLDIALKTMLHYRDKVPVIRRYHEVIEKRDDLKREYENNVFINDKVDERNRLSEFFNNKKNKIKAARLKKYLLDADINTEGFTLKYSPEKEMFAVVDKTGEKAKIITDFMPEKDAIKKRDDIERDYYLKTHNNDKLGAMALMDFRGITNRLFDAQTKDLKKILAEKVANNEDPTIEVEASPKKYKIIDDRTGNTVKYVETLEEAKSLKKDGQSFKKLTKTERNKLPRTEKIKIHDLIAQIGELRGTYFPRQRNQGQFVLRATSKDGKPPVMKKFDVFMPGGDNSTLLGKAKTFTATAFNTAAMSTKLVTGNKSIASEYNDLVNQGYDVEITRNQTLPEDVFDTAKAVINLEAILNKAVEKSGTSEQELNNEVGKLIAVEISNIIKGRGALSSRIARKDLKGDDVWRGYEENPVLAVTKAVKSYAGGAAKRETAQNAIKMLTGRDVSFEEFKAENKGATWQDYQKEVNRKRLDPAKQPTAMKAVMEHFKANMKNAEAFDRIVGNLKGLAVLKFLGFRPSSAVINMTNMVMAVPAVMHKTGRIPYRKTYEYIKNNSISYGQYLNSVYSAEAAISPQQKLERLAVSKLNPGKLSKNDIKKFDYIRSKGWDEALYNQEAGRELQTELGRKYDSLMGYAMAMFGAAEKVNRGSTIAAAFDGIMEHNPEIKAIEDEQERFEEAMKLAHDISDKAHGEYGKQDEPYLVSKLGAPGRSAYTFQKFGHNYLQTMVGMLGVTREDAVALGHMLFAPAVLAGAGASVATPLIMGMAKGFGYDAPEDDMYAWLGRVVGSPAEDFARHGAFGLGGYGVNLKGSLQIDFGVPTTLVEFGGAPIAVATDLLYGTKYIMRGDTMKGVERILPTGFSSPFRAYREQKEGVTTRSNIPVSLDGVPIKGSFVDFVERFFGFNPAGISTLKEKHWGRRKLVLKYKSRRSEINSRIRRYWLNTDHTSGDWGKIISMVNRYNEDVGNLGREYIKPITSKQIKVLSKLIKKKINK